MLFDSAVQDVHNLKKSDIAADAVGVEMEIELPNSFDVEEVRNNDWSVKSDGSLRNFGLEFVSRPFSLTHEPEVLSTSWRSIMAHPAMKKANFDCPRASVHVHVNVRTLTYNQLMNAILAYLLLEGTLVDYCGRWRKGNLFALRVPEASSTFTNLKSSVANFQRIAINSDHRYSAMNLASLNTFGTIEFRMLGSVYDDKTVSRWALGLRTLVDRAARFYRNPPAVYQRYVTASREEFVSEFLGELGQEILKKPLSEELFEDGEEYAVEILSSSTDDWTYTDDFRNDPEYMKYLLDNKFKEADILATNKNSYLSWKKTVQKVEKKPVFNLGVDWSEGDIAVNPSEEIGDQLRTIPTISFGTLGGTARSFRTPAAPPPPVPTPTLWREGEIPPSGESTDIYYERQGRRWIHWEGLLLREAFTSREHFDQYRSMVNSGSWTEQNARRVYDESNALNEEWVQVQLNRMHDEMEFLSDTGA